MCDCEVTNMEIFKAYNDNMLCDKIDARIKKSGNVPGDVEYDIKAIVKGDYNVYADYDVLIYSEADFLSKIYNI